MAAGRPRLSLADQLSAARFRPERINQNEPQPSPWDAENPFDKEGKCCEVAAWRAWEYLVPELIEVYGVGKGDFLVVEELCRWYGVAIDAQGMMEIEGMTVTTDKGAVLVHPGIRIASKAWDHVDRCRQRLGLDPVSRRKVSGPKINPQVYTGPGVTISIRDRGQPPEQIEDAG